MGFAEGASLLPACAMAPSWPVTFVLVAQCQVGRLLYGVTYNLAAARVLLHIRCETVYLVCNICVGSGSVFYPAADVFPDWRGQSHIESHRLEV